MSKKEMKVTIDGKSIEIEVLRPMLFQATLRCLRENFEFRELVKEPKNLRKNKDGEHYFYGVISIFGLLKRIKLAKFNSEEDEELFLEGMKNAKDVKEMLSEFDSELIIKTSV